MRVVLWAMAAALTMAGCTSYEARDMRVASYNIQIGKGSDGICNLDRTAAAIESLDIETIALNEVDRFAKRSDNLDMPQILSEKLKMNYLFGCAFRHDGEYGNGILSKYPLTLVECFEIPASNTENRSALLVKVDAPKPYFVVATHFAYESNLEEVRVSAVEMILTKIKEHSAVPVILLGDLNTGLDSAALARLRELGFLVANDLNPGDFSWPADSPEFLLDYIACYPSGDFEVAECVIVNLPEASDHRPAVAGLKMR